MSTENRARLQEILLEYAPRSEKGKNGTRWRGLARYELLSAIPIELLRAGGKAPPAGAGTQIPEAAEAPRGMTFGIVRSPIPAEATDKMTDEQWITAIGKYNSDDREFSLQDHFKGGASELAQMLKSCVEREPDRFGELALHLPPGTNPVYYDQLLAGLRAATTQVKFAVAKKVLAELPNECGAAIADLLGTAEETLPDDAVDIFELASYPVS